MSIPRAVWTCPVCGFETDFPKDAHPCYLKNCPHQGRQGRTEAAWERPDKATYRREIKAGAEP